MEDNKGKAKITLSCEILKEEKKARFTANGLLNNEAALVLTKNEAHYYTAAILSTLPKSIEVGLNKLIGCDGYALIDIETEETLLCESLSAVPSEEKKGIAPAEETQKISLAAEKPPKDAGEIKTAAITAAKKTPNVSVAETPQEEEEENLLDIFGENRVNLVNDEPSLLSRVFNKTELLSEYGVFYAFDALTSDKNSLKVIFNGFSVMLSGMFTGYENIRDTARGGHKKLVGYSLKENGAPSEIIFAVRGKKDSAEQPFGGATGFVSYASEEAQNTGYWLLRLDGETGRVKM